jgi:pilus assembly protein CpaC
MQSRRTVFLGVVFCVAFGALFGMSVSVFAQAAPPVQTAAPPDAAAPPQQVVAPASRELSVTINKSISIDSPVAIERVSVANGAIAEAVAVNPREVLVNGKQPGETTLVIWQQGGNRLFFDLRVLASTTRLDAVRQQIERLEGQDVSLEVEGENVYLRGTVQNLTIAERALAIASTLGKPINLLNVVIPDVEPQVLLKVRFADVDRAWSRDLGANIFSLGALNTPGAVSTGTFSPPRIDFDDNTVRATLTDALNVFLFRPDLNLGATIRALQGRRLLQILAEPNLLTINGKAASFLAGGEFPYPTLQGGGAGLGAVTIVFREFGIRLNFLPTVTPRGTIRLQVTPEVSSLDYANALTFQGFTIPGLATRRVQTEVELENGQTFALAGLLDNRLTESLSKIPGLGDIPLLGKLFRTQQISKNNTELLVIVTPELVRPIPTGQPVPAIQFPKEFLEGAPTVVPRTPGVDVTGPVPLTNPRDSMPVEDLMRSEKIAPSSAPAPGPIQFVPVPLYPAPQQPPPTQSPAAQPPAAQPPARGD